MPIIKELELHHEGPVVSIYVFEVDTDKPNVQVEDGFYTFNRQLIKKYSYYDVEDLIKRLE